MSLKIKLRDKDWGLVKGNPLGDLTKAGYTLIKQTAIVWAVPAITLSILIIAGHYLNFPTAMFEGKFIYCSVVAIVFAAIQFKRLIKIPDGVHFHSEHEFVINEEGIRCSGPNHNAFYQWNSVAGIGHLSGKIFIMHPDGAYAFTKTSLKDPNEFMSMISEYSKNDKKENSL